MLHVPTSLDVPSASPKQLGLRIIKNWAVSALCLSFLALVLTLSSSAQILYGVSNGSTFGPEFNLVYRIDPATGAISNVHEITLSGFSVERTNALAARPSDGTLFAVITTLSLPSDVRRLVTIDPNTGVATQIGTLSQNVAGLAFRPDGTLWAVTGDGSATPETLFTVNTSNAALTSQFALGNGSDGEAIAFHRVNGLLYHSSGVDPSIFESVDVDLQTVTPIGAPNPAEEPFAMGYSLILNQMFLSDFNGDLFTVNLATGERTFVATIDTPIVDGFRVPNRGLAFVEISTAAPGTISGQIVSRSGEPIHKATVTARDQNGAVYTAISDKRGRFRIVDVPTGETYTISAAAKRYSFPPTLITLNEDMTGLTLTATR